MQYLPFEKKREWLLFVFKALIAYDLFKICRETFMLCELSSHRNTNTLKYNAFLRRSQARSHAYIVEKSSK